MTATGLEILTAGEAEQHTTGGAVVWLHKETLRLPPRAPGGPALAVVRKHLPSGPTLPPVLLVHGFAQNRYTWHTSRRSLSAWLAAQGFDVWNLELRGHGRSHQGGQQGAERFADYVEDVLHAAAHLPARGFWIGHSLGGAAIYGAAAVQPDATLGVIGIGALYSFAQHNWLLGLLSRLTRRLVEAPGGQALANLQIRTRMGGDLLARLYSVSDVAGYAFPISGWWPGSIEQDILAERLVRGFDWTSVTIWLEMSRWGAGAPFDYDALWQQARVPVLVLLGDEDHLLPPGDGRIAYDRSPGPDRTLLVLDDYSHQTHWGHIDLILGQHAPAHVWPVLHDWMAQRARALPAPAPQTPDHPAPQRPPRGQSRLRSLARAILQRT